MKAPLFALTLLMATASLAMAQNGSGSGDSGGEGSPGSGALTTVDTSKAGSINAQPGHPGCADPRVVRTDAPGLYRNAPSDLPSSGAPTTPPTRTAFDACK